VIASSTGGNWTGIIKYVATYHLEFSEYDTSDLTVHPVDDNQRIKPKKLKATDMDIDKECASDGEDDPSWVEPTPQQRAKLKARMDRSHIARK